MLLDPENLMLVIDEIGCVVEQSHTEPFHLVPILDLTMSDRVVQPIAGPASGSQGLISNEEVKVLCPSFGG